MIPSSCAILLVLLSLLLYSDFVSSFQITIRASRITKPELKSLHICKYPIFHSDSSLRSTVQNSIREFEKRRTFLSTASSSMLGFLIADFMAQMLYMKGPIDWLRVARMGSFGFWIHAPMSRTFYSSLDRDLPGRTSSSLIKKIFSEQMIWAPGFSFLLISFLGILKGDSPFLIFQTLQKKMTWLVLSLWLVWPLAHLANHFIIPSRFKPMFLNLVQLCSNIFSSVIISQ